jgi:diguanylate cyclase (GGDEF)-like protein
VRLTTKILSNRVSRRIVLLFIAAAIIPLLLLGGLTLYQIRLHQVKQHGEEIRHTAKLIGMEIFQRLQYTKGQLQLIAESLHAGYTPSLNTLRSQDDPSLPARIGDLFRLSKQGVITHLMGDTEIDGSSLIRSVHEQRIPGKAMLLMTSVTGKGETPDLYLFIPIDVDNPMSDLLGARLRLSMLFDTEQLDARLEQICILNENGIPLYCNQPIKIPWLADVVARTNTSNSQQFTWQLQDHEMIITAFWSLFLAPHYQLQKWSVVVALPNRLAMASVYRFQETFLQVGVITLSLVILLSIISIRHHMVPLERLLNGTRRLSRGGFSTRVEIDSKDEFSELGDAFNDMARRLGTSFDQQAGLIDLSYKLQHAGSMHKVLQVALEALPHFVSAKDMAIVYVERSETTVHLECLSSNDGQIEPKILSCDANIDLPPSPWKGNLQDAVHRLPIVARLGYSTDSEIVLMPVLLKRSVIACLVLHHKETLSPGIEKYFILTQFGDILAASLSNIRLRQRLEHQAFHDPLTHLPNRLLIKQKTEESLEHARTSQHELAMMIMDIDRFKTINDSMGHAAGDDLLVAFAERLKQFTSRRDILSRFAGDEFVFLFASDRHHLRSKLLDIVERLDRALHEPFTLGSRTVRVSASKGIAMFPDDGESFLHLLKNADMAMYHAKHKRAGSYAFFDQTLQNALLEELEIEQNLLDALNREEFELHYQPSIHLPTGRMIGAEALVRWRRPEHGMVTPNRFIPIAEQTGHIEPIGNWVMRRACEDFLRWRRDGLKMNYVSVNVSSIQLKSPDFVQTVKETLRNTGMEPHSLELEITETAFIEDFESSLSKLKEIQQLGVQVAVDDFGTGYASLKYLKELPANRIKIDRLFVKDLPDSHNDMAIISSLITLTDELGLGLIAEGIETEAQKRYLMLAGVSVAQGYLMSRPLPEPELREFLAAHCLPESSPLAANPAAQSQQC